ncbi:hypothetical protein Vretimale_12740 [Volvox reticuliferus]|uniref:Uncharacterized protein n=1 Tax=Volvox reticuliferus TaxID=1737510 RepID=A0A8J4CEW8_9CHLO|nr:hypothetical protein Vretifemale_10052 [Volvox reticuliferus]GIM08792.1 hypothetical protein Vretimale_12740 [Volvox reticuliferus]
MLHGSDDDVMDLPEEVGSLAAWLPISVYEQRRDAFEPRTGSESVLLVPLASQPIPIPSKPPCKNQRVHKHALFELPALLSLASSSGSGELSRRPGLSLALMSSTEGSLVPPTNPVSPPIGNPLEFPTRRACVWGSPSSYRFDSPDGDTCYQTKALINSQCKPIMGRLLDGLQIAAGPLGPSASLPLQAAQAPVDLCTALSSPAAHITREASLFNPASRSDGAVGRKTLQRSEFDVLRAITAFEHSTSWAASLYMNEHDGCASGSCLGCLPL